MVSINQFIRQLMIIVLADFALRTAEAQVVGCSTSWVASANTNTHNGVTKAAANSYIACLAECLAYYGCSGFDWNSAYPVGMQCVLSGSWSTSRNNGTRNGVTHYDLVYNGRCGGCSSLAWIAFADTNTPGGENNPATTVDLCQAACLAYYGCNGIDWSPANAIGKQCFLSGSWTTDRRDGTQPGVTHYDLVNVNSCDAPAAVMPLTTPGACFKSWVSSLNTNAPGGRLTSDTTVTDCQTSCLKYTGCTGIDWVLDAPVGSQCFLTGRWSQVLNTGNAPGVIHYQIVASGNCPGRSSASTVSPKYFTAMVPLLIGTMQMLNNL